MSNINSTTDKQSNGTNKFTLFLKKAKIPLIVIGIIIIICVILAIFRPSESDLASNIPVNYTEMEAKKDSVTYTNGWILSSYVATKQVDSSNAARVSVLGILGQTIIGEVSGVSGEDYKNSFVVFIINCNSWMPSLLNGAEITISLTFISVIVGVLLGILLALGKMNKKVAIIRFLSSAYIFFFRGTPLLMQLFFIYYGLPLISPNLAINNRFIAAWIAFSLNSAAYCAEIVRAAIQSIDKGQFEAAKVLGFSSAKTMTKIIIPQTYRRLIPPVANEFIMVLKDASLTSIIALQDLSKMTQSIMTSTSNVSVYLPSMAIYLVITAFFTWIFGKLEKKFSVYE